MFWLIGIGNSIKDINVKAIETLKKCDSVYMEYYTSFYYNKIEEIEKTIGKSIKTVDREFVEIQINKIIEYSREKNIALLVIGDPLAATTHIDLLDRCTEQEIKFGIINNISIFSLVARTGLQVYKFGKTTSIPFHSKKFMPSTPIRVFEENDSIKAHTLFLLDIDPINKKYLRIFEAIDFLSSFKKKILKRKIVACSRLGTPDERIIYGFAEKIRALDFEENLNPPVCLIIPSELHFMEEKFLSRFKI